MAIIKTISHALKPYWETEHTLLGDGRKKWLRDECLPPHLNNTQPDGGPVRWD